jgi:hypothetical protein
MSSLSQSLAQLLNRMLVLCDQDYNQSRSFMNIPKARAEVMELLGEVVRLLGNHM